MRLTKMSKISPEALLRMVEEKASRRDMAARFGCSEAAISKRLSRMTATPAEPLKIDNLTPKEKSFVVAMARGESQTSAAWHAYDCGSRNSSKSLGSTLMKNQNIKEALEEIRDREIPIAHLVKKLRMHVDSHDPSTSLRAVDMGLKLHDAYPATKNMNLNANIDVISPVDLSKYANDDIIDM
jgi:predicted transcriptional regulator